MLHAQAFYQQFLIFQIAKSFFIMWDYVAQQHYLKNISMEINEHNVRGHFAKQQTGAHTRIAAAAPLFPALPERHYLQ
ncbi:MAG: hypothetical protein Q8Q81_19005 [Oxalobacteraceae bacterium]|nr:hypothetical protein [Oxalobacteraceae bacterium]